MTYNDITPRHGKGHCAKPDKLRKQKLVLWAQVNRQLLAVCNPKLPGLYNRKTDTWRLLAAIAELAGGLWPQKVESVVALLAKMEDKRASLGMLLLRDIRRIFKHTEQPALSSNHLVKHLADMPDRPWLAFACNKPITPRQIANLLRPFGIGPRTQRDGGHTFKGYTLRQFKRAFSRYLNVSNTRSQFTSGNQGSAHLKKHKKANVTDRKLAKSAKRKDCDRVTEQDRDKGYKVQTTAADEAISLCPHCSGWGCERCNETGDAVIKNL